MTPHTLFQHALLDPSQPAPATLSNGQGQEAGDRFDVYRNNVVLSLITAVEAGFPQTRALMREDVFRSLSAHYIREHLPSSPLLQLYGKTFPSYVEKKQSISPNTIWPISPAWNMRFACPITALMRRPTTGKTWHI